MTSSYGQRRSLRLQDYDYAHAGAYFVTLCTQDRRCLLGSIGGEQHVLTDVGRMISETWAGLGDRFPLDIDAFVVMPNHLHGIVVLHGEERRATIPERARREPAPTSSDIVRRSERARQEPAPTLSEIVRRFKTFTANRARQMIILRRGGLWQRNYYEHIIRSEEELNKLRAYTMTNALRWHLDQENPHR